MNTPKLHLESDAVKSEIIPFTRSSSRKGVCELLAVEHGLSGARPGSAKLTCPFCGHRSFGIKADDTLGKCFHPTCGKYVTPAQAAKEYRQGLYALHQTLFESWHKDLLTTRESDAWQYLADKRCVHARVIEIAPLGMIPKNASQEIKNLFDPVIESAEQIATKNQRGRPSGKETPAQARLQQLKGVKDKFLQCVKGRAGWIAFFYTDKRHQITAIRIRQPFTKELRIYKPLPMTGLFGHGVFTPFDAPRFAANNDHTIVTEGEFNTLSLWSACQNHAEASGLEPVYPQACSVGGADSADLRALKALGVKPVFVHDNDPAGFALVEHARELMHLEAVTTPSEGSDLDEFLRSFGSNGSAAWQAFARLISERKLLERDYQAVAAEIYTCRQKQEKDTRREFEIHTQCTTLMISDLRTRGEFYHDSSAAYFFFRSTKHLIAINKEDLDFSRTMSRYGLNATEPVFRYIEQALITEAFERGKTTAIHRLSYFAPEASTLYLFDHESQVYRITPSRIDVVDNGTDGVLFLADRKATSFKADITSRPTSNLLESLIFDPVNFIADTLTPEERRLLYAYYFFAVFFESVMPTKPILGFVGPKGSGKSCSIRKQIKLLFGPDHDLTALTEDPRDFDAVTSAFPFVCFDNVDGRSKWLCDKLAAHATGISQGKRQLHTTNSLAEFPARAFLAVTARTPRFRRDDVADRLLLMKVERYPSFKAETDILSEVLQHRDQLWTEIVFTLQKIVVALDAEKSTRIEQDLRMGDFGTFCLKVAKHIKPFGEEIIKGIFRKLMREQSFFTLEDDPVFDLLLEWATDPMNEGRPIISQALHRELKNLAEAKEMTFTYNTRSFGQRMTNIKSNLSEFFEITERSAGGHKKAYTFKVKENAR